LGWQLRSGELKLVVETPPGFARELLRRQGSGVAVWLDGAMPFRPETARGYVEGMARPLPPHWRRAKRRRPPVSRRRSTGAWSAPTTYHASAGL
jgi:hypothetical protein